MNALLPMSAQHVGPDVVQTVNARDLHSFLEVGKDFSNWIKDRIEAYAFTDGQDFVKTVSAKTGENLGGRPRSDYHLSLDMAKELAMVERNDKGKQARQYFIECERRARGNVVDIDAMIADPHRLRAALLAYTEKVVQLETTVREQAPKVEFHDAVTDAVNCQTVQEVAKVLGVGPNRLFRLLRDEGMLLENNLPKQLHLDAGRFRVVERQFVDRDGESRTYTRTLITGKGLAYIQQKLTPKASKEKAA